MYLKLLQSSLLLAITVLSLVALLYYCVYVMISPGYTIPNKVNFTIKKYYSTKDFVYLVNCKECLSDYYMSNEALGLGERHDVVVLSYGKICNKQKLSFIKYLSSPYKTTWTSRRNYLYR